MVVDDQLCWGHTLKYLNGYLSPPTCATLENMRAGASGTSADEVDEVIFPRRAGVGLENAAAVYRTVKTWCTNAYESPVSHRQMDPHDFDLRLETAAPLAEAAVTIGKHKGQPPEAILACLEANLGFIETPGTVLRHHARSTHAISPGQATLISIASSGMKSNIIATSDNNLTHSEFALPEFKAKDVLLTDATTRAVRGTIDKHRRTGVSSDEASCTIETPYSDKESGIHFLPKTMLNRWTQSEYDGPATKDTHHTLEDYQFMLKLAGQTEVAESVAEPKIHGWQKRLALHWCKHTSEQNDSQECQASEELVQGLHDHAFQHWSDVEVPPGLHLDGFALTMYQAAKEGIGDFLKEKCPPPVYKTKCLFFHSDSLRGAHKAMRASQFLKHEWCPNVFPDNAQRIEINVDEFTAGLWKWKRQLYAHFLFYKYLQQRRQEPHSRSAGERSPQATHEAMFANPEEEGALFGRDLVKHSILAKAPNGGIFSSTQVRDWLRNKKNDAFKKNLSTEVKDSLVELVECGLVEGAEPDGAAGDDKKKKKGGHAVNYYRKRTLSAIEALPTPTAEMKRLKVSRESFK